MKINYSIMSNINIADFKRPGVYIRETDASVRQIPAQTDLINLVAGFSRKGPINKPVLIATPQQLFEVFGDIDRLLEKKGCFFHRTILNILQSSPVWAINLLKTDDQLDQLEWKSISVASDVANGIVKKAPYSAFFNKSEFWYRDTDAFLNVAESNKSNPNHLFHITNMSDKKVSVFMFKSTSKGYDVTLENWYGSKTDVPVYLKPTDLASDYLVSMVVVGGDWSDYQSLSVDNRWSKYFNANGLRKDQINNFINDKAVNVLKSYADLSIIPYFKDINKRDLFIETVINRDTDLTGVFVAFDIDAVESSDYSTGLLDLVGSNLVGQNQETIEYLSYKEVVNEAVTFTTISNNRAGNAFGDGSLEVEGKQSKELTTEADFNITSGTNGKEINLIPTNFFYVLNGAKVKALNNKVYTNFSSAGKIRKDTLYLDTNGTLGVLNGVEVSHLTAAASVPLKPLATGLMPIATILISESGFTSFDIIPAIQWSVSATADIVISYVNHNQVTFTFADTKNASSDTNYRKTRLLAIFNQLQSMIKAGDSIILDVDNNKVVITDFKLETSGSYNKSLTINVAPSVNIDRTDVDGIAKVYFRDDELVFGNKGAKTEYTTDTAYGVVAPNSTLYNAFMDGTVNTGDFFYPLWFAKPFEYVKFEGNDKISLFFKTDATIVASTLVNKKIKIIGSKNNDKVFTVLAATAYAPNPNDSNESKYTDKITITVNEFVKSETTTGKVTVHGADVSDIRHLKMYFVNDRLTVEFASADLIPSALSNSYNLDEIKVFSKKSNYKQTLEIEGVIATNKIMVSAARYSEVKVGDYLTAFVNTDTLSVGEVPKKVTRIVAKRLHTSDPKLVVITTDAQIAIDGTGGQAQTHRYTTMEDYVNTYNAIVLSGFKMRADSMPNGTEKRQSEILDMLAKGTPIFKGLVNRNKISWRYLVDCFGLGLASNSKQQYMDLLAKRLTCLGFLNMPSAKDFKDCTSANFLDKKTKTLRMDYIAAGGDPEFNPTFAYGFAQGEGQSNAGYFFPHVVIDDNGRSLTMPPASFVCNSFMKKHSSRLASVKPWTVVAGVTNGLVTGFNNTEIDLTEEDIEHLNGMGANPIVYKMNRGFAIETNNTAQVSPRSALSFLNVREVLIDLEEELYQMLLTYMWVANTKEVRNEIKDKADTICERFQREKGLYDFINIIDDSNNTNEFIDAQMGILDTFVEPVKAMGYIVNNITILKTGDIKAGGFRDV
jgi:hypothetical protein